MRVVPVSVIPAAERSSVLPYETVWLMPTKRLDGDVEVIGLYAAVSELETCFATSNVA